MPAQGWTVVPEQPTSAAGWTPVPEPNFKAENEKDAQGNAVVNVQQGIAAFDKQRADADKSASDMINAWGTHGPHAVVEGIKSLGHGDFSKGLNQIITGAGITALPMVAPQAVRAVIAAPLASALTVGAGAAAQKVAPPVAIALGATSDQAELAGTVAGLGGSAAMSSKGIPALARWSTTRSAHSLGEAYQQSTRDIQAALGVSASDVHAARPFLEAVNANAVPIVGKEDATAQLVKAADVAVKEIENHVDGLVAQFPQARIAPLSPAVIGRVAQMPGSRASDMVAAQRVIAENGLNQPKSLAEAESLRIRLNAENRAILEGTGVRQRNAILTDPAYVARQQAADSLRDGIYNTLERNGVQGIRDLRRGEGSVLALRNAADPLTRGLRSESTVARTGETSLPRRIGQVAARVGGAAIGSSLGGAVGAGMGAEIGNDLASGLTTKNLSRNALLERAFSQSFTSPPVMSVQGFRMPQVATVPSSFQPPQRPMLPPASQGVLP